MDKSTAELCVNGCTIKADERRDAEIIEGDLYCDRCYEEWEADNTTVCPFCEDCWSDEDLSECFILVDEDFGELGLYRPLSYPYYSQPMIGRPTLWEHAVEKIGSLLPGLEFDVSCPAAYVCDQCMGESVTHAL